MKPQPLPQKALKLGSNLIIADLHLGYEESLAREGAYLPKVFEEVVKSLKALLLKEKPKRLIINGDLKHSFVPFKRERLELKAFFDEIQPLVNEIVVVRGNHDVGITWVKELDVEIADMLELRGWTVVHGHQIVEGERFIMGHEHPAIRLRDEVGALIKVPVFLLSDNFIVLPAFTPWAYGSDILREIVSPLLLKLNIGNAKVMVPTGDELLYFSMLDKLKNVLRKV
ncbi:MAG TPA: metallophosphoesterase [Thermococcus paralvinellae]|uniref:Metallophosphoesterase n=1 Tax=Thermococcus paralvinellae TaxID=582419 RepID=A0A832ZFV6_9EURY|nr:metallophosphoesterase [Thermococcus paralvinellae]HIP89702.1 metallophosphoesterase [Thermococcus paralvinellae]